MRFTVWHVPTDGNGGRTSMYQTDTLNDARAQLAGHLEECTSRTWIRPFTVIVTKGARQSEVATIYQHDLSRFPRSPIDRPLGKTPKPGGLVSDALGQAIREAVDRARQ